MARTSSRPTARPVRAREDGGEAAAVVEAARHRHGLHPDEGRAVVVAAIVQRPREPAQQPHTQGRVFVGERVGGLLEQLERPLVDQSRPPARGLVADCRPGQQVAGPQVASQLGGGAEGLDRLQGGAAPVARLAEREVGLRAPADVVDAQLDGRPQVRRRLLMGQGRGGRVGRQEAVLDGPRGPAERRGRREVVGEVGEVARRARRRRRLERLGHAEVQLGAAQRADAVVERAADELVREAIGQAAARDLLDDPARHGLVERRGHGGVVERRRAQEEVELELAAGHGGELEELGGGRAEAQQPLADDIANALRRGHLAGRQGAGLPQLAPQLADEEGVAAREVGDRVGQRAVLGAGRAADELGDLVLGQPLEVQPHRVLGPSQVGEGVGEVGRHLGVRVAERREQQRARARAGAREVAQEEQRRHVRPVAVLEDEDDRLAAGDAGQ
jgi:hypothetical protein